MWKIDPKVYLKDWRDRYVADLTGDIHPFWVREGRLMDSTKSVWFQGRCAYVYSFAYNNIERRQEYLDMALSCLRFIVDHCFDKDGRMYFEVTADASAATCSRSASLQSP